MSKVRVRPRRRNHQTYHILGVSSTQKLGQSCVQQLVSIVVSFLEGTILTPQNSNKPGHGRKRCPEPLVDGDVKGDNGADAGNANGGGMDTGGGWEGDNHGTSSAPADWEQNGAFAPSAPPLGTGSAW